MLNLRAALVAISVFCLSSWLQGGIAGVPDGPRTVVILHESLNAPWAINAAKSLLESGERGRYLSERGHTVRLTDDDAKDPSGQPTAWVAALAAESPERPAAFVCGGGKLLDVEPLDERASPEQLADEVLAAVKANGG